MKLTRKKRIALELLGPPAVGAGIPIIIVGGMALIESTTKANSAVQLKEVGQMAALFFLGAYFVAGLQSILCTAVMEWRFTKGLDPASWQMVRLSSVLGFGSGAIVSLGNLDQPTKLGPMLLAFGGLGLVVGFIMGLLIKHWSTEKKPTGKNPP